MKSFFQTGTYAIPTKKIMPMIRIYVVNYLVGQFGTDKFSSDSINYLSQFIFKYISSTVLQIKQIVSFQGRTIPNVLHLMAVFVKFNITLDDLIIFLDQKYDQQRCKKSQQVLCKYQTKKIIQRVKEQFQDQTVERFHENIISIPTIYTQSSQRSAQYLPIHKPIDELVHKPPIYTYRQEPIFIQRKDSKENIARRQAQSQNQMKLALSKHRKILSNQTVYEIQDSIQKNYNYDGQKVSFKLFKYL